MFEWKMRKRNTDPAGRGADVADWPAWRQTGADFLVGCGEKEHRLNGLNGFERIFLDVW